MSKRNALLVLVLLFAGCAIRPQKAVRQCPGKKTAAEAIMELNHRRRQSKPMRAAGQCLLRYHLEGKERKENFPVKLWVNPPDEVYLQGDIAFDATGLVFGSNVDEFWFWLKPKEVSTYWWGSWSQAGDWNGLALSPSVVLEAFGDVNMLGGDWSLTQDRFDILRLHNEEGVLLERIYIETCDYVIAKIERLDAAGDIVSRAEFSGYEKNADGFFVPKTIKAAVISDDGSEDSVQISLTSIQVTRLSAEQRQRLFVRPPARGFEHVYIIIGGRPVGQTPE